VTAHCQTVRQVLSHLNLRFKFSAQVLEIIISASPQNHDSDTTHDQASPVTLDTPIVRFELRLGASGRGRARAPGRCASAARRTRAGGGGGDCQIVERRGKRKQHRMNDSTAEQATLTKASDEQPATDSQHVTRDSAAWDAAGHVSKHFPRSDEDLKPTEHLTETKPHAQHEIKGALGDEEDETAPPVGFFGSDNFQRIVITINVSVAIYSAVMAAMLSVFIPQHCCHPVCVRNAPAGSKYRILECQFGAIFSRYRAGY
jgi:hypothetical protein